MPLARSLVRNGILLDFAEYLETREIGFERLRAAVGLEKLLPDDPKQAVPLDTVIRLFDHAGKLLEDPCLGLKFGMQIRPGASGLIGQLAINSPDLRTALKVVMDYFSVFMTDFSIQTEPIPDGVRICWRFPDGAIAQRRQLNLFFASASVARVRIAAGPDWCPMKVELECDEPPCRNDIIAALGSVVRFSAPVNCIELDTACLAMPMPDADPQLFHLVRELAEKWMREGTGPPGIVGAVRDQIIPRLRINRFELDHIAEALELSPRALQWRLEQVGTTFEKVRDETRRHLAVHYLRDTDLPLVEIAHELGFSEQSAFSRAAQRWFEQPPRSYRQQHRRTRLSEAPKDTGSD